MKKILLSSSIFLTLFLADIPMNAQDIAAGFIYSENKQQVENENTKDHKSLRLNELNITAVRDFNRNYGKASDVKWVQTGHGTSVYFTFGGINMRSSYNSKGRKEYTLKNYGESALTPQLRHLVKSNFYDYAIDHITEVERNNHTYYLVKMSNNKEYVTVHISDGEITIFEKMHRLR